MARRRTHPRSKCPDVLTGPMSRLVDEMLDRYVDWREAADAATAAYREWTEAEAPEEEWRYAAYLAALDREESAADCYAPVVEEVERWLRQVERDLRPSRNPAAG